MSSETPTTAQSILFLPNRLHSADAHSVLDAFRTNNEDSNSDNESADDHPPPSPTGSYLSVMPPGHILPSELRLHCLVRAPRATGTNSFTQTAQYVRNLPEAYRLRRVLRSYSLWDNCKAYADHLDQGLTTWSTRDEQAHDLPSRDQQTRAVHRLNSWFITHSQGHTISVNCEAAIQDEVVKQLLDPLNMLLETRYDNSVFEPPFDETEEDVPERPNDSDQESDAEGEQPKKDPKVPPTGWLDDDCNPISAPGDVCMPHWTRAISALHGDRKAGRSKAGFPDFILLCGPQHLHHGAFAEIKTFWTYSDPFLEGVFSTPTITDHGVFDWDGVSAEESLIRQVWGEMYAFRSDYAFFTNGSKVILFIRVGQTSLCVSEIKRWDDPDVIHALIGLSFISIDYKSPATNSENVESRYFIAAKLCPEADLVLDWSKPGAACPRTPVPSEILALLQQDRISSTPAPSSSASDAGLEPHLGASQDSSAAPAVAQHFPHGSQGSTPAASRSQSRVRHAVDGSGSQTPPDPQRRRAGGLTRLSKQPEAFKEYKIRAEQNRELFSSSDSE
ncbi:unnamed protein product [Somion occarium]|uniref:Uncharacterized protein n=1 Tax=Somion occarium TaxID=3059160 RepID=A0ABP1E132_9APHY